MTTWERIRQEEPGEAFGDSNSLNGRPYPSWWTQPCKYRKQDLLEALYGFPYLSWWALEENKFWKFPKIDFNTFGTPSQAILATMPTLNELGDTWRLKSSHRDGNILWFVDLCNFWDADPMKSNYKLWEAYLFENCLPQLQFFGVPLKSIDNNQIYKPDSLFFKTPLNYCPGKFTLMVFFSLMIVISHKFKTDPSTPFIPWRITEYVQHRFRATVFSEKSTFQFPIYSLIASKDEAGIKLLVNRIRPVGLKFFDKVDYDVSIFKKMNMDAFLIFGRWYLSDWFSSAGGFDGAVNYFLLNGPFKPLYSYMIASMKKDKYWNDRLKAIDNPNHIFSDPYSSVKSTNDFMMWSLIILLYDLKDIPSLYKKFVDLTADSSTSFLFQKIIVDKKSQWDSNVASDDAVESQRRQQEQEKQDADRERVEGLPGFLIPDELKKPAYIEAPFWHGPIMKNFLRDFQNQWRETASFHFLGFVKPEWPPKFKEISFAGADFEQSDPRFYKFIRDNPPRRLKVPEIDFTKFIRQNVKWEKVFRQQYIYYLEWVRDNVLAMDNPHYMGPGCQLKDEKGNPVFEGTNPVINSFPDLILVKPEGKYGLSDIIGITMIPIDQAAKFIWGDKWTDFLDDLGVKMWKKVEETLKKLWVIVKENLPAIGLGVGVIAAVGLIALLGVTFLEEEVKKIA
jgi:hypothetical protein